MNNYQVYVFLALLAFSGLSALYRKIQEKRVISGAEANRRQRADEALRTGRDPGLAGNPARNLTDETIKVRRERELAEARTQQEERLRQLREKISGQSTQAGTPAGGAGRSQSQNQNQNQNQGQNQKQPGQGVELWPGGPVVVINPAGQAGQGTPAARPMTADASRSAQPRQQPQPQSQQRRQDPQPMRQAQPQKGQPQGQQQARPQQGRSAASPARPQQRPQVQTVQRSRDDATPKVGRASMTDRAGTLAMTRRAEVEQAAESKAVELRRTNELESSGRILPQTLAQWRSALVANEVLGVPMGLR